jgi:hypothetical protein
LSGSLVSLVVEVLVLKHSIACIWLPGRPDPPSNVRILSLDPISIDWSRPTNIPQEVPINYYLTLTANFSDSDSVTSLRVLVTEATTSIPLLFDECATVELSLVAGAAGSENSTLSTLVETLCK